MDYQPTNSIDLTGRVVLVTGAGSGIGRAMAQTFAMAGASVIVNDYSAGTAEETVAGISGGKAFAIPADVGDEAAVGAMVASSIERFGQIDVLCNNAGVIDRGERLGDSPIDTWRRVMRVNVDGVFLLTRAVLPSMLERKRGVIINTASIASLRGGAGGAAYTASKHAVAGITRSVAWSYAKEGIRCNAICPGATATNIDAGQGLGAFDPRALERLGPVMALAQMGIPADYMAAAALFLASDGAAMINGALLPVDAGWMAG